MLVCGVNLKASSASLALVRRENQELLHLPSKTKRLELADDRDAAALLTLKKAIEAFANQNRIEAFVIKARNATGQMAGGGVSFKIETLFQLSDTPVHFVSPQALARFAGGNMGGIPGSVLRYQEEAFLSGAFHLSKVELD